MPQNQDALRLRSQAFLLAEFLEKKADGYQPPRLNRKAILHGHCHQKALVKMKNDEQLFTKMGLDFEQLDSGCCGMAGSFGFEKEHYDVSLAVGELVLLPKVRDTDKETLVIADGFSCREQIQQTTDRHALHTAQVLQMALHDEGRELPRVYPERAYYGSGKGEAAQFGARDALILGAGVAAVSGLALWALKHATKKNGDGGR
jgi:Fe-S oxidoreductase